MKNFFDTYKKAKTNLTAKEPIEFTIRGLDFAARMKNWIFVNPHMISEGQQWWDEYPNS